MSKIEIRNEDITKATTDIIVNAANSSLKQGSGVCGAIFAAAGPEKLAKACAIFEECDVGNAVITPACDLQEKGIQYIIHAVGPKYVDGQHKEAERLASCYQAALLLACRTGCKSVAFPLIASGKFGYPKEEAWKIALKASSDFIDTHPSVDINIVFVGQNDNVLNIGRNILRQMENERTEAKQKKAAEKKPEYVFFWKDAEENGEFSNWYKSLFTVEGVQYSCVEQYMMSRKALLFKDYPIYDQIMATSSRHQMKALGRQVHNYDTTVWGACREEVVFNACNAKFRQNEKLMTKLMITFGKNLAEASPLDKVWGIGLDAKAAAGTDPAGWPGQNLLGKTLLRVRNENALSYLNFAIDTVKFMTDSQEKLDWCKDCSVYNDKQKPWPELSNAFYSIIKKTYSSGFVVYDYNEVTDRLPQDELSEVRTEWLETLTDGQLLRVFAAHIRTDHFCDDYLIEQFIPSGKMLRVLEELKKRTLRQMQTK